MTQPFSNLGKTDIGLIKEIFEINDLEFNRHDLQSCVKLLNLESGSKKYMSNLSANPGIEDAIPIFGNYSINTYVILTIASWRHIGYIMLLYLAGLKSVDPSLREAAAIDGATEWQTFRKIVLPAMKPVNTIIIVITVIESLRAFDLIYIIYGTSTGWPILGMLVFTNIYGQAASMLGAAFAVILFLLSIIPIVFYLRTVFRDDVSS